MPEDKTIVIMGVARGGTSMTTGLVSKLGVHIATNTPEERQLKFNKKGMYEHKDFYALKKTASEKENVAAVKKIFAKHSAGHPIWGFKNMSQKTIGEYIPYMNNPHLILVTRSAADNARSWQAFTNEQGGNCSLENALMIVTRSALLVYEVIAKYAHLPHHITTYESIRSAPIEEAKKLANFIGIEMTEEMANNIRNFVDPDMRTWKDKGKDGAIFKQ